MILEFKISGWNFSAAINGKLKWAQNLKFLAETLVLQFTASWTELRIQNFWLKLLCYNLQQAEMSLHFKISGWNFSTTIYGKLKWA